MRSSVMLMSTCSIASAATTLDSMTSYPSNSESVTRSRSHQMKTEFPRTEAGPGWRTQRVPGISEGNRLNSSIEYETPASGWGGHSGVALEGHIEQGHELLNLLESLKAIGNVQRVTVVRMAAIGAAEPEELEPSRPRPQGFLRMFFIEVLLPPVHCRDYGTVRFPSPAPYCLSNTACLRGGGEGQGERFDGRFERDAG